MQAWISFLYCCAAYRAMNAAALKVYEAIRTEGTQKHVIPLMQTRADLYKFLDYHAYEAEARCSLRQAQALAANGNHGPAQFDAHCRNFASR